MSAIMKSFKVRLSREQERMVRKVWNEFGKDGGAMLVCQPVDTCGPFALAKPFWSVGVMDPTLSKAFASLLEEHRKSRP